MSGSKDFTYEDIGYDENLFREEGFGDSYNGVTPSIGADPVNIPKEVETGQKIDNLWISSWIKSRNFQPKTQGFRIDGREGYIECMKLYVGSGGIIGGKLDVPDETSANSFHVESDGDTYWGCNNASFLADNDNAAAYILKTGVAKFQNAILTNNIILDGLQSGSEIAIQGWQNTCVFSITDFNTVAWTSGSIVLLDGTVYSIDAGNTGNMSAFTYIYLDIASSTTVLQTTTTAANAVGAGKILIGVAQNNSDNSSQAVFQIFGGKGGQVSLVDNIAANSASTNEFVSNTAQIKDLIVTTAKIDNLAVTNAKINDLAVGKLTAGTINSVSIILNSSSADGVIRMGKTNFNNTEAGFILGGDFSDSSKAKFYIGDSSRYLNWNGSSLTIKGDIQILSGTGVANLTDAGDLAIKNSVDLSTAEVSNKTADNISESVTKKWAGETGADVTGSNVAASITSQGNLATRNTVAESHIDNNAVTSGKISVSSLSAINASLGTITSGTIKVSTRINIQKSTGVPIAYLGQDPNSAGIWGFIAERGYGLMCRYSGANYFRIFMDVGSTDAIIDMPSPNKIKIQDNEGNAIGRWYGRNAGFSGVGGLDLFGPVRLYTTSSPPTGASNGMMFYHTTWDEVWVYKAGAWKALAYV